MTIEKIEGTDKWAVIIKDHRGIKKSATFDSKGDAIEFSNKVYVMNDEKKTLNRFLKYKGRHKKEIKPQRVAMEQARIFDALSAIPIDE